LAQSSTGRREERAASHAAKNEIALTPLTVERIAHPDIPDVCALYKRVWDAFEPALPPGLLKAWQPTPLEFTSWMEGVTYFAARRDGKVVGVVGCEITDNSCRIVHLAVTPEGRRLGVGSSLANAAIEWARHSGSNSVWVDALERFHAAHAMFRQLGFTESGVLHRHRWNEDVRLFEKLL
jgi:GNAT superfamily N-acetyltransferase